MILLDSDNLGLFFAGHPKVVARVLAEEDQVATGRIEFRASTRRSHFFDEEV